MVKEVKKEEEPKKKSKKLLFIILSIVAVLVLAVGGIFSWKVLFKGESQFDKNAKGQKVQPVVGTAKTAKAIKSADGGTIELEKSTLTLEKDALPATKEITVAKIDSIGGLDSSWQYVSGVQLGPDGTELDKLSTLKLEIPAGTSTKELMGFSYDADGKDFHFYPIKTEGQTVTFQLTGFSGYGILLLKDQNKYPDKPSTIQGQAEFYIGRISGNSQRRTGGIDEDASRKIKNILLGWYNSSVKPQLKDAQTDETKLEAALSEMKAWIIFSNIYFADEDMPELEEAKDMAAVGVKNASEKASKACTAQKDPTQAIKLMRYYKLAAGMLEGREGLSSAKIQEMIKKCVNFELKITSTMSANTSGTVSSVEGNGTGYLATNDAMKLSGEATFTITKNQIEGMKPCRITTGNTETWKIVIPEIPMDSSQAGSKMDVEIDLFEPAALNWDCLDSIRDYVDEVSETDPNEAWDFDLLHQDELLNHEGESMNFLLKDWDVVNSGGVFARKKYDRTKAIESMLGLTIKELTVFELVHTPK